MWISVLIKGEIMDRIELFKTELDYIQDKNIKEFVTQVLLKLPNYFFEVAASSTGKYHPKYSLGHQGLVRHTKSAVRIAVDILGLEMMKYKDIEKDIIIASLILHDGLKHGVNGDRYTVTEHPLEIVKFIERDSELTNLLDKEILETIFGCIRSHMGEWNSDYKTKREILPKPKSKLQNIVHLADYLSSRKYFSEFDFSVSIPRR